jgi:hypothetical protein
MFLMVKSGVLLEVRTELLNITNNKLHRVKISGKTGDA